MAKTTWGRKETIIWPYYRPLYTYGTVWSRSCLPACFCAVVSASVTTPLQRYYMPVYERTSVIGSFTATHPKHLPGALSRGPWWGTAACAG